MSIEIGDKAGNELQEFLDLAKDYKGTWILWKIKNDVNILLLCIMLKEYLKRGKEKVMQQYKDNEQVGIVLASGSFQLIAGEDIKMSEYMVLGEDGMVYPLRKRGRGRPKKGNKKVVNCNYRFGLCREDVKKGELVTVTI